MGGSRRLGAVHVTKSFPGVRALKDVSLDVDRGEIHALVGENGAGKSTLMNLVSGVHQPDSGTIELDGEAVSIPSESAAVDLGVAMVHQEGSLVPTLSVAENIFGGRPPLDRFGFVDREAMVLRATQLLEELSLPVHPGARVATLSPAQAQMLEIAKAVARPLRVLILDEPTAALSLKEADHLFRVVRRLAADGVAVVYVSHRLAEVFALAGRVTVLKDGAVTGVRRTSEADVNGLIHLAVGRELSFEPDPRRAPVEAPVVLEVEELVAPPVHGATFNVRAGEIVCLSGLIGSGRTELCEAIFGARPVRSGQVRLDGRELRLRHPGDAVAAGIGMVPEDRKRSGLFLEMDVVENIAAAGLPGFSTRGLISPTRMRDTARRFVERLTIRTPNLGRKVVFLSGGNQQKVLLARWLVERPRLLIVDEPTRGVDVGARAQLYEILRELAAQGTALLVVSSDLLEVLAIAHRIVVLAEGRIAGELDVSDADEASLLRLASPQPLTRPVQEIR